MQADEVFRLSELTRYIQQVLSLNFESAFWIEAEVNQVSESRGNFYLELVEKDLDSEALLATMQARIWRSNQVIIRRKLNSEIRDFLQAGVRVKFRGSLKFHPVYGMSFQIEDIDQDFTLGELERKKLEVIDRLKKDGVFELNKSLELSPVVQRLAVISSRTAAGLVDFINQLQTNQHDIPFSIDIYHAAVQGVNAVKEINYALTEINNYTDYYDAVCILRGGGSKLDLSAFDDESMCRTIGMMQLPVLTGIGHEIDTSVADLTAHTKLKTPTALASFIVDQNVHFLAVIYESYQMALTHARRHLHNWKNQLTAVRAKSETKTDALIQVEKHNLKRLSQKAEYISTKQMLLIKQNLNLLKIKSLSADPQLILGRGYTLVSQNGNIVKSSKDILSSDDLTVLFKDGKIETQIK